MSDEATMFYDLPHCYLEVARGILTTIHFAGDSREDFIVQYGHNPINNALFSLVSISIIYSYLAIEAMANYNLHYYWEKRHDGSPESKILLSLVGDCDEFQILKTNKKTRELGERLKTLCSILGIKKIHEVDPILWRDFKELSDVSRHYLIHPYPDKEVFQNHMERIMSETESGKYIQIAENIMTYFLKISHKGGVFSSPSWLSGNTLLRFRGVDLLVNKKE